MTERIILNTHGIPTRLAGFLLSAILLSVAIFALSSNGIAEDAPPPNFVIILADDLGYGDIGAMGSRLIATPAIDRMASEGVTLKSFYASANICTPSRGGLLTGRYPVRLGLTKDVARPNNQVGLAPEEITLAEKLKEKGYRSALIGKWHLGHAAEHWPTAQGFDYFFGLPYSNDMSPLALYRMNDKFEEPVDQTTLTERYTIEAIQFMEASKKKRKPFFLYLAHTMPHVPLHVSPGFSGKSKAGLYGDVVETIDWSVGRILKALDQLDLDSNTLVIFTSDNGPWWEGSSGVHRDRKGSSWEGGMRVPFIARWPGTIPAGAETGAISMNIDLFPTLAALAGCDLPQDRDIDGRDIFGILKGGQVSPHEYLYLFNSNKIAAVRTPRWKLVTRSYYRQIEFQVGRNTYYYHPGMLFDLQKDPEELYSFAREQPEVVARISEILEEGKRTLEEPYDPRRRR